MLMATHEWNDKLMPIQSGLTDDDRQTIVERALEIAASLEAEQGEFYAEFVPGVAPSWHVATVVPGLEADAIGDLTKRRFGVYDPTFDERYMCRGRPRTRRVRLLPGYLLVFTWDIGRHWKRITSCVGVRDIVKRAGTDEAFTVPDEFVDHLQRKELTQAFALLSPKASRKRRRYTKNEPVVFHTKSYLQDQIGLADAERIASLFHRALSLAS